MGSRSKLNLLAREFEVTSLSFPRHQDRKADLRADIELVGTTSKIETAIANLLLLSGRLTRKAARELQQLIARREHDIVFLDTSYYGWIARYCRRQGIPCVAMIHNVEFDFEMNRLRSGQWAYVPSFLSAYVNERLTAKHANAVISLHKEDSARLAALYGRTAEYQWPVLVDDTISDAEVLTPRQDEDKVTNVLFVGTSFYANMEAVLFFIKEVLPRLGKDLNIRFQVVGRGFEAHKDLEKLDPRVVVYGKVADVHQFYLNAAIVIAPIFSGAGMKVKIAEAMMYARPVVASSFALIGYEESIDADNLISADAPDEFARAVERLARSSRGVSVRNREEFKSMYSYDAAPRYLSVINDYLRQLS